MVNALINRFAPKRKRNHREGEAAAAAQ